MIENDYLDLEEAEYVDMSCPYGNIYKPIKWKEVIDFVSNWLEENRETLTDPERETYGATLRFLYYRIIEESGLLLPHTKNTYDSFIRILTRARKDYHNTDYDVFRELIIDDTRNRTIEQFKDWQEVDEDRLKLYVRVGLTEYRTIYPFDKYVEVWFEDDGSYQMYRHIPKRYRISTECLGGNLITNSVYGIVDRIRSRALSKNLKDIVILYCGDFNPSGNRKIYNLQSAIADFGLNANVYKVLVTPPQIKKYNILPDPESPKTEERIQKAKRDPLIRWFIEKYGSNVFDVNAQALNLDLTEKLITSAIEHFIDASVLDNLDEERTLDYNFGWDEDEERYFIELPNGRLTA